MRVFCCPIATGDFFAYRLYHNSEPTTYKLVAQECANDAAMGATMEKFLPYSVALISSVRAYCLYVVILWGCDAISSRNVTALKCYVITMECSGAAKSLAACQYLFLFTVVFIQ